MTVVVAFLCTDGVVVAADSMITPSIGQLGVGHHKGRKIEVVSGPQIFAFAGDLGQAARFRIAADLNHGIIEEQPHPINYPLALTQALVAQFNSTGIDNSKIDVNTVLAFLYGGQPHCCVFERAIQPRLLDQHHFYVALGIGKLSADPFLRFLVDVFCTHGRPNVREAIFLATWTIEHVINTNPGGVAGPIKIATFETAATGGYEARELPENEIDEHQQAMESAAAALRKWRDELQSGKAAEGVPEPPPGPRKLL
jgi:hypothetical protein